jgi:HEAT repeat protein
VFKQFLEKVADTTVIDIIQLDRSISHQLKQQVEAAGAEVLRVLSGGRLILSTPNAETRNIILSMDEVSKVEQYIPSISLEERFIEYLQNKGELADLIQQDNEHISLLGLLIATFFKKEYRDQAAKNLGKLGIKVVEEAGENILVIDLINHPDERKAFWTVFNQPGLRSIEEDTMPEISSFVAVKKVVYGEDYAPDNSSELPWTGTGEIIAIADTGIDTGIKETLYDDFRMKVVQIKKYSINYKASARTEIREKWGERISSNIEEDCSAADSCLGHDTHVFGIADRTTVSNLLIAALQDTNPQVQAEAALSLAKFGTDGTTALIQALQSKDLQVRQNAAIALGEIGSKEAVKSLTESLSDPDETVRYSAAEALGLIGDLASAVPLSVGLKDPATKVRQNAAIALAQLPSPSSISALLEGLQDLDPAVGASVAMALGKQSLTAIKPQLLTLVHNQEPHVRRNTALALGYLADDQGLAILMDLLKNDPDSYVREGAVTALGRKSLHHSSPNIPI